MITRLTLLLTLALLLFPVAPAAHAEELRVVTWNVESSRDDHLTSDPATIASGLGELQRDFGPFDLIGLTEVPGESAATYAAALRLPQQSYAAFLSATGRSDRMMIAVNLNRFEVVTQELGLVLDDGEASADSGSRRPLFVTVTDRLNPGLKFTFMVNHLDRGNDRARQRQARLLREWVKGHPHPVIAVGDYNFDFDTVNLCGNQSMSIFLRDAASERGQFAWRWVVPGIELTATDPGQPGETVTINGTFRDTNWDGDRSGRDRYPTSILDFIFLGGAAKDWNATSTIIVRDGDFPDNERTSDHRPVMAVIRP